VNRLCRITLIICCYRFSVNLTQIRSAFLSSVIYSIYLFTELLVFEWGRDGGSGLFQGNIRVARVSPCLGPIILVYQTQKKVCLRSLTGVERRYCWY